MSWKYQSANVCSHEVHAARQGLADYLTTVGASASAIDAAAIIVSELYANVVRYAPGPIDVALTLDREEATLSVRDQGPCYAWACELPRDIDAESGRGLALVTAFASSHTVRRISGGCVTTVTFPLGHGDGRIRPNAALLHP